MGAWEPTIFGNDAALDWAAELREHEDWRFVEKTLRSVGTASYVNAEVGQRALAACAVVTGLLGRWQSYPGHVRTWVGRHPLRAKNTLIEQACAAIDRVLGAQSELREMWERAEEYAEWRAHVDDLRARLCER